MSNSVNYRKDIRSTEVFQSNIKDFTEREQIFGEAIRMDFEHRLGAPVRIAENGVDNTGEFIPGNLDNHNADKVLYFTNRDPMLLEIKTIPEYCTFMTFKSFCIKNALRDKVFILVPRLSDYYMLGSRALEWIIGNVQEQIHFKFSANDPAYRIYENDIAKLIKDGCITYNQWSQPSREFVDQNKHILTRKKRT